MANIEFLNIDLDIVSKNDLAPIIEEFGDQVCVLNNEWSNGNYYASFETGYTEENKIIETYVALVNDLSPDAGKLWNECILREFNFGYNCGETPHAFRSKVSSKSVKGLSEIGGSIVVTIYSINDKNT
ncbi:MAG: hypothetical protein KAH20_12995 [Methylococcales bacterium]|nr:hypothetical protein [Methylococcales bacterium]